jgi:hypothetical protein
MAIGNVTQIHEIDSDRPGNAAVYHHGCYTEWPMAMVSQLLWDHSSPLVDPQFVNVINVSVSGALKKTR